MPDVAKQPDTDPAGPPATGLPSRWNWLGIDGEILALVCGGGLFGGLLFYVMGGTVTDSTGIGAGAVAMFGGACAAGIGVFVLANSEQSNRLRLLFFSVVCGFSYPVVLEAAKTVAPTAAEKQVAAATDAVKRDIVSGSKSLATAIEQNPALDATPDTGRDLALAASAAIESIGREPDKQDGVEALKEIGLASAKAGYVPQAQQAIERLEEVATGEALAAKESITATLTGQPTPPEPSAAAPTPPS